MTPEAYLAFLAACMLLMLFPGPSVLMTVGHGLTHGLRGSLPSIAGTTTGFMLQVSVALLGLASFLILLAGWFEWLRWAGVTYLAYLGVRAFLSRDALDVEASTHSGSRALFAQAFLVATTNPKTLLFYAAFFPQFLQPGMSVSVYGLLGASVVLTACLSVVMYAAFAGHLRRLFTRPGAKRAMRRTSGVFFLGGAVALALARKPA